MHSNYFMTITICVGALKLDPDEFYRRGVELQMIEEPGQIYLELTKGSPRLMALVVVCKIDEEEKVAKHLVCDSLRSKSPGSGQEIGQVKHKIKSLCWSTIALEDVGEFELTCLSRLALRPTTSRH